MPRTLVATTRFTSLGLVVPFTPGATAIPGPRVGYLTASQATPKTLTGTAA